MFSSRIARIPIELIVSEVIAFPLASETAFRTGITEMDPMVAGSTGALWRGAEDKILESCPAVSVDELVALRDLNWFHDSGSRYPPPKRPLSGYLRYLARTFLEEHGAYVFVALPPSARPPGPRFRGSKSARARWFWRWLSFAIPVDLLVAGWENANGDAIGAKLLAPPMEQHLRDEEFAEVHLHMGAAIEFPVFWVSTLRAIGEIGENRLEENAFESPSASFDNGREFGPWLVRVAIVRYLLAEFLTKGGRRGLHEFVDDRVAGELMAEVGGGLAASALVCIQELSAGRWAPDSPRFADLRHVYSRLTGAGIEKFPRALDEVQRADPIARFFRWVGTQGRTPEMQFVSAGLVYLEDLEKREKQDALFSRLFWQAIKLRSLYYRYIVQRPLKPGLQWFIRTYGRLKRGRRPISEELLTESAARLTGLNEGLRSLELRVSPEESTSEMLKSIVDIDRAFMEVVKKGAGHTAGTPQIGLVFHFTKDRGAGAKEGRPRANGVESEADPRSGPNPSGCRYAAFYNQKKAEAQSLVSLLTRYPLSLEIIRGIDTATDELGIPNWVLVPLYRYVRAAGRSAARVLSQRWNITAAPLRATAHVGEDYVHLLTGLRNVEEAVRYLDLKEGDRIGHGMSLGTDPHDWCERTERVLMAYEDRLFDLVWEWSWYSQEHIQPPLGRGLLVEREIARLSEHIYDRAIAPYRFEAFIDKLHDEQWLKRVGFPNGPLRAEGAVGREDVSSSEGLLRLYLTDGAVFARGRRLMIVDPSFESEALAALQAGVRRKLCEKAHNGRGQPVVQSSDW